MEIIGLGLVILGLIWTVISFIIKVFVYAVYFLPFIGYKILDFLSLWPHIWPLNGVSF